MQVIYPNLYRRGAGPPDLFNADDGAEEHRQLGNLSHMHQVAFDWLDEVFNLVEQPDRQVVDTLVAFTPELGEVLQV